MKGGVGRTHQIDIFTGRYPLSSPEYDSVLEEVETMLTVLQVTTVPHRWRA